MLQKGKRIIPAKHPNISLCALEVADSCSCTPKFADWFRIPDTNLVKLFDMRIGESGKQPKNIRITDANLVQLFDID